MKKKRPTFQCGSCNRKFSFQKEITAEQEWIFTCPYCGTELSIRLEPYKVKTVPVLRGDPSPGDSQDEWDYNFPEVILAQPR